jgi:hypothetical protein
MVLDKKKENRKKGTEKRELARQMTMGVKSHHEKDV